MAFSIANFLSFGSFLENLHSTLDETLQKMFQTLGNCSVEDFIIVFCTYFVYTCLHSRRIRFGQSSTPTNDYIATYMPDEACDGWNIAFYWQFEVTSHLLACLIVQKRIILLSTPACLITLWHVHTYSDVCECMHVCCVHVYICVVVHTVHIWCMCMCGH